MPQNDPMTPQPLFDFRILVWFEPTYQHWIARCLETGSVATAETQEVCRDMIRELLIDELQFNLDRNNLANLFGCPAGADIWARYHLAEPEPSIARAWPVRWNGIEYDAVAFSRIEVNRAD